MRVFGGQWVVAAQFSQGTAADDASDALQMVAFAVKLVCNVFELQTAQIACPLY